MKTKMKTVLLGLALVLIVCAATSARAKEYCGASQGFWKNHPELWSNPSLTYNTGTLVMNVFDNTHLVPYMMGLMPPYPTFTFLDVLTITVPYCSEDILITQAVAALLNAQQFGTSYPLSAPQVIQNVNDVLNSGGPYGIREVKTALADQLDRYNSAGLPKGWP
jgi:hypothetical protein